MRGSTLSVCLFVCVCVFFFFSFLLFHLIDPEVSPSHVPRIDHQRVIVMGLALMLKVEIEVSF
jgi:hypothetical protein